MLAAFARAAQDFLRGIHDRIFIAGIVVHITMVVLISSIFTMGIWQFVVCCASLVLSAAILGILSRLYIHSRDAVFMKGYGYGIGSEETEGDIRYENEIQ